jgi:hypothetical protein
MNEVGSIQVSPDGKYLAVDVFSGETTEHDNLPDAIAQVEDTIAAYADAGMLDTPDDGNGSDGGNGGDSGTPPSPPSNPPLQPVNPATPAPTPAPVNPAPVPTPQAPAPLGKPKVNPVQPGDRRVNINIGRDGNKWDIIDNKTRKVIARAQTREIAEEIAAGVRGLDGKVIDYTTPQVSKPRGPAKFPRPKGYKRTPTKEKGGYFVEKENDPNSPVARVQFNRDSQAWEGKLYANKQDAEAQRNPIGEPFSDAGAVKIDGKANEAVQKELDRLNPPAPATPAPQAQPAASNHQRTDLGSDMFSLHDGNKEYGIAEKGADGKWTARLHENPRDALSNRNPIATGSFDSPEEAEAAMRQAIADRNAPPAAEMLQWQSGSDGKQYLGLDGVAGIDANNAPVYGISPGPFGGWIVAGWSSKADKDAGLPPVAVTNHADEKSAKDAAKGYAQQAIDSLAPQQPVAPSAPAPIVAPPAPNGNGNAPEITPEDQLPLYIPFNPNANPAPRRRQQRPEPQETPPELA